MLELLVIPASKKGRYDFIVTFSTMKIGPYYTPGLTKLDYRVLELKWLNILLNFL